MQPTLLISDEAHLVGTWHNVLIEYVRGATSVDGQRLLTRTMRELLERHPQGIVQWLVIPSRVPIPQAEVREAITETIRGFRDGEMLGIGLAMKAQGFWAGAARSVATGVAMAARLEYPLKVFPDEQGSAAWLAELAGHEIGWKPAELVEALRQLLEADGA